MENRHGLVVDADLTPADGYGERDAALRMAARIPGNHRATVGADKVYDMRGVVDGLRALAVTPHVAQMPETARRSSAIDERTTRHPGYEISQAPAEACRGGLRLDEDSRLAAEAASPRWPAVGWVFTFTAAVYNLVRMRTLLGRPA